MRDNNTDKTTDAPVETKRRRVFTITGQSTMAATATRVSACRTIATAILSNAT